MTVDTLAVHTVTIEQNVGVQDGRAQVPEEWVTWAADVRARVRPTSARERSQWLGMPTFATHIVYIPETNLLLTEQMRIKFGTRILRILGVRNVGELDRYLAVDCEEVR